MCDWQCFSVCVGPVHSNHMKQSVSQTLPLYIYIYDTSWEGLCSGKYKDLTYVRLHWRVRCVICGCVNWQLEVFGQILQIFPQHYQQNGSNILFFLPYSLLHSCVLAKLKKRKMCYVVSDTWRNKTFSMKMCYWSIKFVFIRLNAFSICLISGIKDILVDFSNLVYGHLLKNAVFVTKMKQIGHTSIF